jgi:hypothetical protein
MFKLAIAGMTGVMCLCGSAAWAQEEDGAPPAQEEKSVRKTDVLGDKNNPYSAILARNLFALVPQPPPPKPPDPAKDKAATSIKLTGFISESGQPVRALLFDTTKAASPTNTIYYDLREGERNGDLELIKINSESESADVRFLGVKFTVALKDNKATDPKGAPNGSRPGSAQGKTIVALPNPQAAVVHPTLPVPASRDSEPSSGGSVLVSGGMVHQTPDTSTSSLPIRTIRTPQVRTGQMPLPAGQAPPEP